MTISVNEAVFGIKPQPERIEALSWAEALYYRKLHGNNVRLPAHMGHLSLAELQAKADEETRPQREAAEAAKRAKAIENAGTAMERALFSGPPRHRTPGRIRACFLAQLERWGSVGQAAAAAGVSVRTIQRWRNDNPAFNQRCEDALDRRQQLLEDKAMTRAGKATAKPFFYKGQKLGEAESYNDSLLMRMIGQLNSRRRRMRPAPAPAPAAPAPDPAAFAQVLAASLGPVLRQELARALETERRRAMSPLVGQAESDPFPV
ncbi:MAG: hypothetical protein HYZ40_07145 [Rhodospirillales bacterium]|nr:hypothetical protein [Rhodospirillales bacterium]